MWLKNHFNHFLYQSTEFFFIATASFMSSDIIHSMRLASRVKLYLGAQSFFRISSFSIRAFPHQFQIRGHNDHVHPARDVPQPTMTKPASRAPVQRMLGAVL
jgi:hypothetical protein